MSKRIKIPPWLLLRVAERDKWKCHVCGQGYISGDPWHIDHDKPRAKGGTNHVKNLRLAHRRCNHGKSDA